MDMKWAEPNACWAHLLAGRLRQYADALSAGLDAALDRQPYGDGGSASRRPPPSNILCIRVSAQVGGTEERRNGAG